MLKAIKALKREGILLKTFLVVALGFIAKCTVYIISIYTVQSVASRLLTNAERYAILVVVTAYYINKRCVNMFSIYSQIAINSEEK